MAKVAKGAGVSLEEGGPLDKTITREHIVEFSDLLSDWETVAAHLGIDDNTVEGLKEDHRTFASRRLYMLRAWASENKENATYRRLREVFVNMRKVDRAEKVFEAGECLRVHVEGLQKNLRKFVWLGGTMLHTNLVFQSFANGPRATYRKLGEALIQLRKADSAVKVFELGK